MPRPWWASSTRNATSASRRSSASAIGRSGRPRSSARRRCSTNATRSTWSTWVNRGDVALGELRHRGEEPEYFDSAETRLVEVDQQLGVVGPDRPDVRRPAVAQQDVGLPVRAGTSRGLGVARGHGRESTGPSRMVRGVPTRRAPARSPGATGENAPAWPAAPSSTAPRRLRGAHPRHRRRRRDAGSFLEYAYSVIYSRALPDARDGLKPVQRRILYTMDDMGLRPDRGHVKSARVVGEVMGRLHPHGDGAIYDALVRMAQPWSMRLPIVDGHGNFGSPDDPPGRDALHRVPDGAGRGRDDRLDRRGHRRLQAQLRQPRARAGRCCPAAIPNLVVNGATGIAVGMATNIAPHNLVEVVQALRHLITHPDGRPRRPDAVHPRPRPADRRQDRRARRHPRRLRDRPRHASGCAPPPASRRSRRAARASSSPSCPTASAPRRSSSGSRRWSRARSSRASPTSRTSPTASKGLRLVIEVKNGFVPEALLEQLYKLTPMEDSFGINAVALVDGQPRTLGLKELLEVFLGHRFDVVRRRSAFRRAKAADRLHLVEGLLVAILDIDEVIQLIRASDNAARGPGAADRRSST